MKKFYRPEWTSGRYNSENRVAIIYNLIEGMSYFLEDESADVVGHILKSGRSEEVDFGELLSKSELTEEILNPFLEQLSSLNLLVAKLPDKDEIDFYRRNVANWKKSNPVLLDKTTKEKLPFDVSNAEMAYTERVGGITSVMFELTYMCSEQCIHCYNIGASRPNNDNNQRNKIKSLSLKDYKKIIDELVEQGLVKATLSGGDPFSNPDVWEIIKYLYEKEVAFDVFTNGQRLIGKTAELANFYPRLVGISIYSESSTIHDKITRVKGSWEKSIKVLQELGELSVPLNIKCCIMQPNFDSYKGIVEIAKSVGAHPQFEIGVHDSIEGDKYVSRHLRLTPEQYEIVLRDDNIPLYVGPEAPNYGGQKKDLTTSGCGAGKNTFCIRPDGMLIPCCSFHLKLGNLKESNLEEILHGEPLKQWHNFTLADSEECGLHNYCDYCNLCVGHAYSQHEDYRKSSENCCYLAQIRFKLAHKLMKETY